MTDVRTFASWSARDTDVAAINGAIRRLRGQHDGAVVRAAVLTLVVLVDDDDAPASVTEAVREIAIRSPIHALTVAILPDGQPRIDARVNLLALARNSETKRCVEDVFLRVCGPAAEHVRALVEHWARPSLPVVVWCPTRLPRRDHPLLASAQEVLVDGREVGAPSSIAELIALSRRLPVTDLTWVRLAPWRELVAGMFMGDDFSPFLRGVHRVEAAGRPWPRLLLAGWIMGRLQLTPTVVRLIEADRPAVHVLARHRGRQGSFTLTGHADGDEVHATATIEGRVAHRRTVLVPRWSLARVLDRALAHVGRDDVWEQSLAGALELRSTP